MADKLYVQLSEDSKSVISYFTCAQDEKIYPNQKVTDTSDPLWSAYYQSIPELLREGLPQPA